MPGTRERESRARGASGDVRARGPWLPPDTHPSASVMTPKSLCAAGPQESVGCRVPPATSRARGGGGGGRPIWGPAGRLRNRPRCSTTCELRGRGRSRPAPPQPPAPPPGAVPASRPALGCCHVADATTEGGGSTATRRGPGATGRRGAPEPLQSRVAAVERRLLPAAEARLRGRPALRPGPPPAGPPLPLPLPLPGPTGGTPGSSSLGRQPTPPPPGSPPAACRRAATLGLGWEARPGPVPEPGPAPPAVAAPPPPPPRPG